MDYYKDKMKQYSTLVFFILILCVFPMLIKAQNSTKEKQWKYLTEVYLMFPYMSGEAGLGESLMLQVDANPSDVFDKLKMAGMLYFEANHNKWAITTDLIYMNLNQDLIPGKKIYNGVYGVKQLAWEIAGLYRLSSFLELGLGGRLNSLQSIAEGRINVFPAGTEEFTESSNQTWYDPILIARFAQELKEKWLFQLRTDVGGFGIGSDLSWQIQGYAGYRFSKTFQLSAGYRVLSIDYKSGEEPTEFKFNMKEFGPVIRFGINL